MTGNDLGGYLRTRREAITPAEVGLPTGLRRRTPGLRRGELATLAGVSVEYLTRLEQGRDRHPSSQVLAALADALRLTGDERIHLFHLSKQTSGNSICPGLEPPTRAVRPTIQALLRQLEPAPAAVFNRLSDVVACTTGFQRLAGPTGLWDTEPANLVRFLFTDARARTVYPDWDHVADEQVANLRLEFCRDDPHVTALIDELTVAAGGPFTQRLAAPAGAARRTGVLRWVHPEAGELRLAYEGLELPDADDQRLVVYLPADDATSAALDRLAGRRPGGLRAVAA